MLTSIRSQRSHSTPTTPVAINILDQNVVGGTLHSHTFILVGDFHVVDMDVASPDIDAIKSPSVTATNDHIVDLAVTRVVHDKMECRSYSKISPSLNHEGGVPQSTKVMSCTEKSSVWTSRRMRGP